MTKNKIAPLASLLCLSLLTAPLLRAQKDPNQALIDLLVRKGVLSKEDVAELKQEVAAEAASPAPEAAAPAAAQPAQSSPGIAAIPVTVDQKVSPLSFKIGAADFTPFGFMDFTGVFRSTNVGSGISTNFGSIPYSNASAGQLSETRFSSQNSRIGLRIDSKINDTKVLGYIESDFLGNAASNLNVTSNAATLRMRLYFAEITKGPWELLAGQTWSLITPNRVGLSPIPSDLFYTMDMDIAYQAGLVWARQPGVRVVYHGAGGVTSGLALENPDQYIGGVNGAGTATLPSNLGSSEVDSGASTATPNQAPDVVAKLAYDTKVGGLPWHAEVAGLYRSFKVNTYAAGASPVNGDSSASGEGASFNVDLGLTRSLSFVGTSYVSEGGGRYIFAQAPDFVVNPPNAAGVDTISDIKSWSFISGLEWKATSALTLFGYYSEVGIGQSYTKLSNGSYVGYGYPGSASSQNRRIEEFTLGLSRTLWKDPAYGALQVIAQASYVDRDPWYVAAGAPSDAHTGMIFFDLRYILP